MKKILTLIAALTCISTAAYAETEIFSMLCDSGVCLQEMDGKELMEKFKLMPPTPFKAADARYCVVTNGRAGFAYQLEVDESCGDLQVNLNFRGGDSHDLRAVVGK